MAAATEGANSAPNYDLIDQAVYGDEAQADYGVSGAGIKIGIISDSFDKLESGQDYQTALADGLVSPDAVYSSPGGLDSDSSGEDEGLAMAEIVHEIAPDAQIYFYTGIPGGSSSAGALATAINQLAADGCNVICDDLDNPNEPFYEEGGTTDTAINNAVADGITYVTCAINSGADSFYEGNFLASNFTLALPGETGTFSVYNFGTAGSPNAFDTVTVPTALRSLILEWDQPFLTSEGYAAGNGSAYSLDFVLYNLRNAVVATGHDYSGGTDAVGLDPVQNISSSIAAGTYKLVIVLDGGTIPAGEGEFKIIGDDNSDSPVTFAGGGVGSGSTWGHNEDPSAITVGAAPYSDTPAFGGTLQMEQFSASGPGEYLVGSTGAQLSSPVSAGKTNITAPDGGYTSDPDISNFYGTSAATPAVAAVVADMLQKNPDLTPAQIDSILAETAIGFGNSDVAGAGLVDAFGAVAAANPLARNDDTSGTRLVSHGGMVNFLGSGDRIVASAGTGHFALIGADDTVAAGFVSGNSDDRIIMGEQNVFSEGSGSFADTVVGFDQAAGDRIHLTNETIHQVVAHGSWLVHGGQDAMIALNDGSTILLKGVTDLNASFFT